MRLSALVALGAGLAAVLALVLTNNAGRIAGAVAHAGPGLLVVVALHLPQTLASAAAWAPLIVRPSGASRIRLATLARLRFIREAVNALLPVANVGGDVVRARLLARTGASLSVAAASCTADLTVEMATQAVFTLAGVAALLLGQDAGAGDARVRGLAVAGLIAGLLISAGFLAAQRFGLVGRLAGLLAQAGARARWPGLEGLQGLGAALQRIYADPRRLAASAAGHLLSWFLGVLETGAALWALGLHPSWREALVVESLGQVVRAVGFAVPGALGVQEGGYILICGLFGVPPASALALSLVRRVREIALGAPGLLLWQWAEVRDTFNLRRRPTVPEAL